jgi:hypothetical protein
MSDKETQQEHEPLDEEELEKQEGEPLPDREVMTILPIEPTETFLPEPPD